METSSPKLTTTVYRYNRYGNWMLVSYALATMLLFIVPRFIHPALTFVLVCALIGLALYVGLRPKSIFSVRSVDDRELTLTPESIQWGTWLIPVREATGLRVEVYSIDELTRASQPGTRRKRVSTRYGDNNELRFSYRDVPYSFTFYLGTAEHYAALVQIIAAWRENGISFEASSVF